MKGSQDLARRADLHIGDALIRPSIRTITGPLGSASVEPRVMQVLLALYDADGAVLNRETLLEQCWSGLIVGDDAVNRTIAEIRRVARDTGAAIPVETIPRVGYRIATGKNTLAPSGTAQPARAVPIDRRALLLGGAAAAATIAGGSAVFLGRRRDARIEDLIMRGRHLQVIDEPEEIARAQALFRKAVDIDPDRASSWGWLATTLEDSAEARAAAQRALDLDSREPNARVVLASQRFGLDGLVAWEQSLLDILADAPENGLALQYITLFYQGMGLCRRSWDMNERGARAEPFNPTCQHRRALKLWIFGHLDAADKVSDQALRLWQGEAGSWIARMTLYAFTDRARAGLALLDDVELRPTGFTEPSIASWRATLQAIETRSAIDKRRAVEVFTRTAGLAPGLAANAVMTFSYLGMLDEAYSFAEGLFEAKGPLVQKLRGKGIGDIYSLDGWGRTQFLFIPATAPFRDDARFTAFCERIGLTNYWRTRKVWPDRFVRGSLRVT